MDFKQNDQVMVRRKIRTGNLVRIGSVLKIDGDKALVQFPLDYTQAVIPVSQLEKTGNHFGGGYKSVQVHASRRGIYPIKRRA